jgi:hypothetical protein
VTSGRDDLRAAALDAYLERRAADGYEVETRTAVQAVIVRRRRWPVPRALARRRAAERRLVVSVDELGEVLSVAAEPRRW